MAEKVFANCTNSGPVSVYVKDGKIVRIRPLVVDPDDYEALGHRGRRQGVLPAQEGHTLTLRTCGASSHLLRRAHQVPHEAGGFRSQRRAQPAEPRQVALCTHLLGRSGHAGGFRAHARQRDIRWFGHQRPDLLASQLGHRRLQDGARSPASSTWWKAPRCSTTLTAGRGGTGGRLTPTASSGGWVCPSPTTC